MARTGEETRHAIDDARDSARRWKGRAAEFAARVRELTAQVRETRARLAAMEEALQEARQSVRVARHALPSVSVTERAFVHRLRTLPARRRAMVADGREEQLLRVSAAYRSVLDQAPSALDGSAHTMTLDGLTWRVPFMVGASSLDQVWIDKQRLPFHGILQTREVAAGGIMLDLGANIGRMAIPRLVLGDVTHVYCAEPDPVTYACLARNVIDNDLRGLVLPDQTAIGDRDGTVRLRRAGASGGFSVVAAGTAGDGAEIVEVPSCTLDTWIGRLDIDLEAVTFIKVDVEGFERRVLAGASRVLACPHIAWQMEIFPDKLRAAGDDPERLYGDLQRAFTHFVDVNRRVGGRRDVPISELPDALRYIEQERPAGGKTDILLFTSPNAHT